MTGIGGFAGANGYFVFCVICCNLSSKKRFFTQVRIQDHNLPLQCSCLQLLTALFVLNLGPAALVAVILFEFPSSGVAISDFWDNMMVYANDNLCGC